MATKNDSGNKRKLPSRSNDSASKKPKYEKRPPAPPADEDDHDHEGGASLKERKSQKNGDKPGRSNDQGAQAGKAFERGERAPMR